MRRSASSVLVGPLHASAGHTCRVSGRHGVMQAEAWSDADMHLFSGISSEQQAGYLECDICILAGF